ncbi:hypothetical protein OBBRIDRAFT_826658 [Obba rivulosa]|uniref:Uncharacterized protein n=1 Tax=Obba rivulosa TaxID=1052685 RepID=A0A8E2AWB7_9APHY|nr:hypothetical protein OBBRIDRAFT_826658 [Obba rivulosa]
MSETIPQTIACWTGRGDTTQQSKRVQVKEYPVPPIGDSDILVKTVAIATHPEHPVDLRTAAQALDHPTRLGLLEPAERRRFCVLTSLRLHFSACPPRSHFTAFVVRFAHRSGYKVLATTSPCNFDLVKSLGTPDSQMMSVQVMRPEGGKVVLVLKLMPETKVRDTLIYTSLGRAFDLRESYYGPISPKDRAYMAVFLRKVPALVKNDKIIPNWIMLGRRRFGTGCSICARDKSPFVKGTLSRVEIPGTSTLRESLCSNVPYHMQCSKPTDDGGQLQDGQLLSEHDVVPGCVVDLKGPWPLYDAGKGTASAVSIAQ